MKYVGTELPWITAMFRTGRWAVADVDYAAKEFPSAFIDAHAYWHSSPDGLPEDLATCAAAICAHARQANRLLGLVVAGPEPVREALLKVTEDHPTDAAYLTTCPNDRDRLVDRGDDRVCPTCGYVIVNGATR